MNGNGKRHPPKVSGVCVICMCVCGVACCLPTPSPSFSPSPHALCKNSHNFSWRWPLRSMNMTTSMVDMTTALRVNDSHRDARGAWTAKTRGNGGATKKTWTPHFRKLLDRRSPHQKTNSLRLKGGENLSCDSPSCDYRKMALRSKYSVN